MTMFAPGSQPNALLSFSSSTAAAIVTTCASATSPASNPPAFLNVAPASHHRTGHQLSARHSSTCSAFPSAPLPLRHRLGIFNPAAARPSSLAPPSPSPRQREAERTHSSSTASRPFMSSSSSTPAAEQRVLVGAVSPALGPAVKAVAAAAIADHGHFSVAISGGSLPKLLAAALYPDEDGGAADASRAEEVDTTAWRVFLADERIVALDDADSNYLEVRTRLPDLSPVPINPTLPPEQCAKDYAYKIRDGLAGLPFDLVLLGLGPDGHTCSLFPEHPLLEETERSVAEITNSPKPPPERVTLTLPKLARSHNIFFVVTGSGKAPVVKDILENPASKLPGALVKGEKAPRWFLDEGAAGELSAAFSASL